MPIGSTDPLYDELRSLLVPYQQQHLLEHWFSLDGKQRQCLTDQIKSIDLMQLARLTGVDDVNIDWSQLADLAEPPPAVHLDRQHPVYSASDAKQAGELALRSGKIGMILVAGGQGTRLGFDLPKALFPIGPISGRTLLEMHIHRLQAIMRRFNATIPLYVMTSPATDSDIRSFIEQNHGFGMAKGDFVVFCQGSMPAVDAESGRILLSEPGQIAFSPDGHGGLIQALAKCGRLADAASRGIEHFYYAQIDNPLAELCDPRLLGYHLLSESDMTTQVVQKRFATEKVGNVVFLDDHVQIIEYSDLPDEVAGKTNPDGSLYLWPGNIAIHVFDRAFLESIVQSETGLPFHRAKKAVPFVDSDGKTVTPTGPNAIKFERFVFDLLPLTQRAIVVEGHPADVFAPVKNANGAPTDTPAATQQALINQHRKWLQAAGAVVSDGVQIEIHPRWALDETEVAERIEPGLEIVADSYFQ